MNALDTARLHSDSFLPEFVEWLSENPRIYEEFEIRALRIYRLGRKRYSSRRIIEELRLDTQFSSKNGGYKINDHVIADVARLFMLMHPECGEFFELRRRPLSVSKPDLQVDLFRSA